MNHIIYVQPNAAFFFREKACVCPTTRKARLVRTRRKKDAAFGKFGVAKPARRGRLSFARTCIRYLRERILYSVNTNTRRQAKLIVVLLTWLGNAVGVFNECKSSRADSECRFSFFGEAKKSKCPAGMKRMVKATPKANHNALTHFQAASPPCNPTTQPSPIFTNSRNKATLYLHKITVIMRALLISE